MSRLLWDHLPLLPFTQFPWRFLSVASFFLAPVSYTHLDAADERSSVDLGGRRIIKKKNNAHFD